MLKFKKINEENNTPFDTSILDGISDPVLIVDEQELVIDYNKAYKRLLEADPSKNSLNALTNNKNIKRLNGKPLIAWSIKTCLQSKYIKKIVVSTDSKKYAKIAKKYGAHEVIMRPKNISKNRDIAYAMAKANTEKYIYEVAEKDGNFEAISINPLHVIGPLMTENHNQFFSWQFFILQLLKGVNFGSYNGQQVRSDRMLWNMVDVRDVAKAHRMAAESDNAKNGSRYILSASDTSGEMFTWELQAKLRELFPHIENIGGERMEKDKPAKTTYDSPRSYCKKAMNELGLSPIKIEDTLRETGESYERLGLL